MAAGYLPEFLRPLLDPLHRYAPWIFGEGGVEIGPIPAGTPINLLANLDLVPDGGGDTLEHKKKLLKVLLDIKQALKSAPVRRERRRGAPCLRARWCRRCSS